MNTIYKIAKFIISLPLFGVTNVPTTMHDARLARYVPKIKDSDFSYNPMHTPIARCYKSELTRHKNASGATLLDDGFSAFLIRAAIARMAIHTIDLQTYIYDNDLPSRILLDELKNAADRGVKVRILLDDYGTNSDIVDVMVLNQHPNIEIKVFNTVAYRAKCLYYPQFFMEFNRLNSRMHNKLFIVDSIAYITGGRNVGSNYFYPETSANFSDTDVLFIGDMTRYAEKSFNEYWNHHLSIPASVFPKSKSRRARRRVERRVDNFKTRDGTDARKYNTLISMIMHEFQTRQFDFHWGRGQFLADSPDKVEMPLANKENYFGDIVRELGRLWRQTTKSVYLSAAYFVPGYGGLENILHEEKSGVHITIVTNSLASTNAPTVYAKWEKYRKMLIDGGADVYEFMPSAENRQQRRDRHERRHIVFSALHSKTIVFDDKISWIGSFNLDPRSTFFNTENVSIFRSSTFAKRLRAAIMNDAQNAWHVGYRANQTIWTGRRPNDNRIRKYYYAPDAGILKRIWKTLCKLIPEKYV